MSKCSEKIIAGMEDVLRYTQGDATGSITHVSESNFMKAIDHFMEVAETGVVIIENKWVMIPYQMYKEIQSRVLAEQEAIERGG